jgi:S4 domain protein YaaA
MEIQVRGEYITLGQLLKLAGEVQTGGEVKDYLAEISPIVNGEPENRRGRKLRPGDVVEFRSVGRVELT